ncbi:MAG: archease [Candidatus Aenigmatarchaeota archaeon]
MRFKFLEDMATADVAFEAYGKTLEEAFANSALAMFEVQTDVGKIKPIISKDVEIVSENKESLLFDWLSELLYFRDIENMFFGKFDIKIEKNENFKLTGKIYGEKIEGHELRTEVKGVSYQLMKIEEKPEFKIRVILDV